MPVSLSLPVPALTRLGAVVIIDMSYILYKIFADRAGTAPAPRLEGEE